MDLICNELSFYPLADDNIIAENRFTTLLKTFNEAKKVYGFKRIRFHTNYVEQLVTVDKKFFEWVSTVSNSKLRNLIISFFRKPFADDDLNDEELNSFLESDYKITNENVPTKKSPIGLPIAHIKSTISLSFNSHKFWQERKISILKTNTSEIEKLEFTTYNICLETDLKETEIIEWADNVMSNTIDSKEMLIKYLSYSKYNIVLTDNFIKELFEWKNNNIRLFKDILFLMKDVSILDQVTEWIGGEC